MQNYCLPSISQAMLDTEVLMRELCSILGVPLVQPLRLPSYARWLWERWPEEGAMLPPRRELCSILGVALERAMLDPWCSAGAAPEVAELCSVALGALARGGGYAPSEERAMLDPGCCAEVSPRLSELCSMALGMHTRRLGYALSLFFGSPLGGIVWIASTGFRFSSPPPTCYMSMLSSSSCHP